MSVEETSHTEKFKRAKLKPQEIVIGSLKGYIGQMMGKGEDTQQNGALILTNFRIVEYRKGIFGEVLETIPLQNITSIETKSFMGHRVIKFHTSHDELQFKTFASAESLQRLHDHVERLRHGDVSASESARTNQRDPAQDPLEMLKRLGELKSAGIITEAEFELKKKELLTKI